LSDISVSKLANGVTVISEKITYVKSFSLGLWVNTGSLFETPDNNGISHFIEHMVFKGTKTRSAKKISDEIESLGGYLNAFTSKENTCFYGRGLNSHFGKTFEVISDLILNPLFKPADIKKEAGVVIDELHDIEDSPEEIIFEIFETELFKKTCYELPIIGTEETISNFSQSKLFNYISKQYATDNILICASGMIEHEACLKLANKYFSSLPHKSIPKKKKIVIQNSGNKKVKKDIQQSHFILGKSTVGYDNSSRTAINLMSHILGGGSSSRLFQSLRERNGITYQINSFLNSFFDISSFGIYFSTNPHLTAKAISIIKKELTKINSGDIKKSELDKAKEFMKGSLTMNLENITNRMMKIAQSYLYFNKVKLYDDVINEINNVDLEKINCFAKQLCNPDSFIQISIEPK